MWKVYELYFFVEYILWNSYGWSYRGIEVAFWQQKQGGEVLQVKSVNLPISKY